MCEKIISDINCNTLLPNEEFINGFAYIYIFQLNKANGDTITQVFIREKEEDEIKFNIGQDGYYTLCQIVLPTVEGEGYYYMNGKFYKALREVELDEIVNVNPELSDLNISYYYYFQLCKLQKCYIQAAKSILDSRASINCNSNKISSEDIYKRDLIWSAMNTIKYLAENEQFEEAERLLERITTCNGLCNNLNSKCGCGCGN